MKIKLNQAVSKAAPHTSKLPQQQEIFTLQRKQMEKAADFSRMFWAHQPVRAAR